MFWLEKAKAGVPSAPSPNNNCPLILAYPPTSKFDEIDEEPDISRATVGDVTPIPTL